MKITDLIIDPRSLGSKLWLVEVSPAYEYRENRKTDTVLGYRYTVAMPEKGLDKINVRIDGDKRMDAPDGYAEVRFDGSHKMMLRPGERLTVRKAKQKTRMIQFSNISFLERIRIRMREN